MSSQRQCPVCGKPTVEEFRPFCTRRCADIDLNRWLSEGYVVPGAEETDDGDGVSSISGED
jgi:hypothetical protein